jgi:acyl dehydratase
LSATDTYLVGREKVREYAAAIGERAPVCHDVEAARAAGYADVVAPPMFAAVYSWRALGLAVMDPELGVDYDRLVHGGQDFTWHAPVVAGDEITTEAELAETAERAGFRYYTFTTRSTNQRGELVCEGKWLNIVR